MKIRCTILLAGLIACCSFSEAQNPTIVRYINTYKYTAINEMKRTGVPAAIKLAQGILETQAGESDLVRRSNNHFGIKCKTAWIGPKVYHDDDERGECFRAYADAAESYRDHSDFLKNSQRYAFLFQLNPEDYKEWAKGLKKAGYATNPKYWQQLVKYIEDYNLNLYTLVAMGKKQITDESAIYTAASVNGTGLQPVAAAGFDETNSIAVPAQNNPIDVAVGEAPAANYPDGIFEINNTRVVWAKAGSSLLAVAEQYNIRFKQLLEFNDLPDDAELLRKDQPLFLQRKRKQGANDFTILYRNEQVYDVAQREGLRLDDLLMYNFLEKGQQPQAGSKLFLKKDLAAESIRQNNGASYVKVQSPVDGVASAYTPAAEENSATAHTVQPKETLYSIAKKYNVTVDQVKYWNKLTQTDLRVGQQLMIYKN